MQRYYLLLVFFLFFCFSISYPQSSQVKVIKHSDGQWQLLVDGKPYFIKGVVYNFAVVGDDPNEGSLRDWSILDLNKNGRIDVAYDSWVDVNKNNLKDPEEKVVGDWQLLREMGCNTIRIYHMPIGVEELKENYPSASARLTFFHPPNKQIFRDLFYTYGIRVAIGHFFGEWTIGSGAEWEKGTDYTDPVQRKNLLKEIEAMVKEHKDEPYTLIWIIGNENFNPYDQDNAEKEVEAFLSLVNQAAQLIHQLDPNHPVALCNWNIAHIKDIAKYAPDIDIFALNIYPKGKGDFGTLWNTVKMFFDRPVLITEYGCRAIHNGKEDEDYQAEYLKNAWQDIVFNKYGNKGIGNSIGGFVCYWCDSWYLDGLPWEHNIKEISVPTGQGIEAEEWLGITSQGNGTDSPFLRQLRKAYFLYKELWNK